MDKLWSLPVAVAASFFLIWGAMLFASAWRMTRLRWRPVQPRVIAWDEVPPQEQAILDAARPLLERLGFELAWVEVVESAIVRPDEPLAYGAAFRHVDGHTLALVTRHGLPEADQPCVIRWASCFDDRDGREGRDAHIWQTWNGYLHFHLCADKQQRHFDDVLASDEAAYHRHRQRVVDSGGKLVDDIAIATQRLSAAAQTHVDNLVRARVLTMTADGTARLRWTSAFRWTWTVLRGQRRVAKMQRSQLRAPTKAGAVPATTTAATPAATPVATADAAATAGTAGIEADVRAFGDQLAVQNATPIARRGKWQLLLVTALAFVIVGGVLMSWRFAFVLLAVIALHEGGHYLAMKWTGHRNLSVFFIPGLGGLATGEKAHATPLERFAVYMAGPVPGLLLAVAGLLALQSMHMVAPSWLREFLVVSLIVNLLNLLPITPLDGGRVVEVLLLSRRPWWRFAFTLLGVAALLGFGLVAKEPVMTAIGAMLAMSLPFQWQVARVRAALHGAHEGTLDEATAVRRVFEAMRAPGLPRWPFLRRAAIARTLLPELQGPRPQWHHTLVGTTIYLACLLVPMWLAYQQLPFLKGARYDAASAQQWPADDVEDTVGSCARPAHGGETLASRLARVDLLPEDERIETLLEAADDVRWNDREAELRRHLDQAWALAKDRPAHDVLRAKVMLAMADSLDDREAADDWRRRVVRDLDGAGPSALPLLAQAKEALSWNAPPSQRVELLRDVLRHRIDDGATDEWSVRTARTELARALYGAGSFDEAQALLRVNVDDMALPPTDDRSRRALNDRVTRVGHLSELGWFLLSRQRVAEARATLDEAKAIEPVTTTRSWVYASHTLAELQLWVAIAEGGVAPMQAAWTRGEGFRQLAHSPHLRAADRRLMADKLDSEDMRREAGQMWNRLKPGSRERARAMAVCEADRGADEADTWWRSFQDRERMRAARAAGWCAR